MLETNDDDNAAVSSVVQKAPSPTSCSDFLHEYLHKTDLSTTAGLNQFVVEHQIIRDENETDEAFTKRVKKINYLNLAQQLIRNSSSSSSNTARQIPKNESKLSPTESPKKPMAPLKRMKPVFAPAEDPDFDDEFEPDDSPSRDIFDDSSSSTSSDDEQIHPQRRITSFKSALNNNTFASDIKQKLSNLAADVVRTFGSGGMTTDDDFSKPLPSSSSFPSRLFLNRAKETTNNNQSSVSNGAIRPTVELSQQNNTDSETDQENDDAELLYTNESLLPQVDWENLERQLKQAQIERERYDKARLNDRDEIRRKLAAGNESEGEGEDYYTSDYIKKTMITTSHRRLQGSNLQICFVNEHHHTSESSDGDGSQTLATHKTRLKCSKSDHSSLDDDVSANNADEDILVKQQKLKEEAKVALMLGAKMARMQVEIERRVLQKKKSPLYDIIGIDTNGEKPLSLHMLEDMNIGQLQVIVNDLHCQIEAHNDELVNLLMERDTLSMEQDSILVDIEDLTKRLQECAASRSPESKRASAVEAPQRVYIVKPQQQQPQPREDQKKSLLHNLLRKATFLSNPT